jgi:hypothetical protein
MMRGPYEHNCAGDEAFQLAYNGCTTSALIELANKRGVGVSHILGSLTKGTRPKGKLASMRMGGREWHWGLLVNGQPSTTLNRKHPQDEIKLQNPHPR